ncbi:Zinc-regulated transporter [Wickerhamomyces ciferrii]|uniref:Zinc-regulated transporter n=1 Tax=Wickerhamomyces ciferrii (strain ATCC 14091 / BCRC 22168 / CBS 111 / JCM 3599 / NBRC 0793 / NRRL Y-1031 F-60-10) TaxID=1206466 RepID=K0KMJ7_WICCF|nr:Zinc-regulated transporter [Wickerhamomyces ciferrii]CCH43427.1 Zinc-regulated transporter [Wickerhamomyces ciferrii]
MSMELDPDTVLLTDPNVDTAWKTCVLQGVYFGESTYDGQLGARISSIFVILIISTLFTIFPLLSKTFKKLKLPLSFYTFARYFGSGVIISTAFIHLMDPAYLQIGMLSCVGGTGDWGGYPWCAAIILVSVFTIFLVDLFSEVIVEQKYGQSNHHVCEKEIVAAIVKTSSNDNNNIIEPSKDDIEYNQKIYEYDESSVLVERSFRSQIAAFLVLEFGIIFHSVLIGLNLGVVSEQFKTFYIVVIFHQSFEGLGLGARLSAIPWPKDLSYGWAYAMCIAYGLVTPLSTAIGLGVRTTYLPNSYNALVVTGVLDAISAGILIYTGLVELLARDILLDKEAKRNVKKLLFKIGSMMVGAGIMAVLGKWV